jgi:predicted nucleotidyltransferase
MKRQNSTEDPTDDATEVSGASIGFPLPVRGHQLFNHGAAPHILNFLGDNPDIDVSIRQLARVVPMSERATREAVDALEANDLLGTYHRGNARRVHINRDRLDKPADPVRNIPQTEFQTPVRVGCRYIEEELDDVRGVILFGSVARGTADRRSDIDLWVLVADDHLQQRHEANKLVTELEDLQIPPTVALADARDADFEANWEEIRTRLEADDQNWASAQRHAFEIIVETPESILAQSDRVEPDRLFGQGITLRSSELLDRVKREALSDE